MTITIQISEMIQLHRDSIILWKKTGVIYTQQNLLALIEENHAFNYKLWHAEDKARRDDMGYEFVYRAKREIDDYNQQRNNRMEAIDDWFFTHLKPAEPSLCPVHSETPGMIIDRLSILALKAYHMEQQTLRQDADNHHILQCQQKLTTLLQQQSQLYSCLEQLLNEIKNKTRTFKLYRQLKMYNDPNLNPQIYQHKIKST
ncbi:Uncharacterised protein [Legionella beliardensis]|uniref:DUF4254 domain-containing protein n=1 Tax=Legionella beliardensis TaxID=91822 RepID=A0A378ICU9_9GAMM|nr:DUF4254 domain-containing protein [Legionella beliardensis]STX30124.1 Uncharacterised protein [Legionella beliardensis]